MTCIAAVVDKGLVYMGGDSAAISGWDLAIRRAAKVFRNGHYLIGYTTSYRMGQILQHAFVPPAPPDGNLSAFMCTRFVDSLRDVFKAAGYAKKESDQESAGNFLVGIRGHLFQIWSDYSVGENLDDYGAVGCGEALALGALYASAGKPPEDRVRIALGAAERFSAGVRGPFVIESIGLE